MGNREGILDIFNIKTASFHITKDKARILFNLAGNTQQVGFRNFKTLELTLKKHKTEEMKLQQESRIEYLDIHGNLPGINDSIN